MIFFQRRIVSVVLVLMFACSTTGFTAEQLEARSVVVARVGNIMITQEDIERRMQNLMPMQLSFHGNVSEDKLSEIEQSALDELIVRAYKIQYAIDEEISIDSESFETQWQKQLSKNSKLSNPDWASEASKFRADYYLSALAREAETVAIDERVNVSDNEVRDYYLERKASFFRPKLYTVSHVFIKVDPSSNKEELEVKRLKAEGIYKRAISGEDFYNLAYYESDDRSKYVGGSLGSFHAGQTISEFDAVINEMQPGEIVGPLRTRFGFHIVRLDDVSEERQLEFEEVSAQIRSRLKATKRDEIYNAWLTTMKVKYPIEYFNK